MNCPNCGSTLNFQSERAPYAVCSACSTMVVRKDLDLESLGAVAECQPDGSPIQLGTQGTAHGRSFQVIGRIQLSYGDGFWNEWYLLYTDGSDGWLGEALGQYFLSKITEIPEAGAIQNVLAKFSSSFGPADFSASKLTVGENLTFEKTSYTVLDRKTVSVSSFEGELPFVVQSGSAFLTVDLRSVDGGGLTVDFSDGSPLLYKGEWLHFSDFGFQSLRTEYDLTVSVPASAVRKVSCASCGAPHEIAAGPESRLLVCAYCGSAMDSSHPELKTLGAVIDRAKELAESATLPLGTEAHFSDAVYRTIGFVESSTTADGIVYTWTEYLLYNHLAGYRWLSESDGHFTLFEQISGVPKSRNKEAGGNPQPTTLWLGGASFRHFQTSKVTTQRVVGEFYWRVQRGDSSTSYDYVAPPYLLSASRAKGDITWSLGRYLESDELRKVFPSGVAFPTPRGVAPNQPNLHVRTLKAMKFPLWAAFLAGIVLVAGGFFLPKGQTLLEKEVVQITGSGPVLTKKITIPSGSSRNDIEVSIQAPLSKDGFTDFEVSLGTATKQALTLAKLGGKEKTSGTLRFLSVPSGTATLAIVAKTGPPGEPPSLRDTPSTTTKSPLFSAEVSAQKIPPKPAWGGFFLFFFLLMMPSYFVKRQASRFETQRWYESQYG